MTLAFIAATSMAAPAPSAAPSDKPPAKDPGKAAANPAAPAPKAPATDPPEADPPVISPKILQAMTPEARRVLHLKGPAEMEPMAKADPLAFLKMSLKWYDTHVSSYTCTFIKQEQVGGELLKTETMDMKFREKPFSVRLRWNNPNKGQEGMYVEGQYKNKLVVHPVGILALLFPTARIEPTDERAMKRARRPITCAGIGNMMRLIIFQCDDAKAKGDLQLEYVGIREEGGRQTYVFKRTLPRGKEYPAYTMTVYIDQLFMIPIRSDAYDWDGNLLGHYRYMDLILNPTLTDDDFNPDKRF